MSKIEWTAMGSTIVSISLFMVSETLAHVQSTPYNSISEWLMMAFRRHRHERDLERGDGAVCVRCQRRFQDEDEDEEDSEMG